VFDVAYQFYRYVSATSGQSLLSACAPFLDIGLSTFNLPEEKFRLFQNLTSLFHA
jgi:hypothetical protein